MTPLTCAKKVSAQIQIEQHSYFRCVGKNVLHDFKSIATKVCSQISCKWNAIFEGNVVASIDRTSFDFQFEDFFSNLPL